MDAIVCGHICIDITPTIPPHAPVPIEEFFHPGALVLADGIEITPGGAVTNTGLALNRLGFDTALIGRTGDDSFADMLAAEIGARGGRAQLSRRAESRTSYSVILTPPGSDRVFLHDPGANNEFSADDVDDAILAQSRVIHFGYPTVMRRIYEDGGDNLRSLFARAHRSGTIVSLDTAVPDPDSEVGRLDWHAFLRTVLPEVDLFAPSLEEIAFMVDRAMYDDLRSRAGTRDIVDVVTPSDLRSLGDALIAMGVPIAVIKLGGLGLYMRTAPSAGTVGALGDQWNARELFSPSFRIDSLVAGTGAGDVSIAGLIAAILRREPPERSIRVSCAAGAQACRSYDAIGELGSYEAIKDAIDGGWRSIDRIAVADRFRFDSDTRVWIGPADRATR
jgi:sugar/nucleoside kinase (ribokinase family)